MAQAILYQILDHLPTLEADELRQFNQALLVSGLVKQIKLARRKDGSQRSLIEVQDEHVSETILEERR